MTHPQLDFVFRGSSNGWLAPSDFCGGVVDDVAALPIAMAASLSSIQLET